MKQLVSGASAVILTAAAMTAQAEVTGNIGWDSEYIFRGISQSDSSVNGGIDWEEGIGDSDLGVYLGTWAADVDEGLEIDYYGGVTAGVGDFDFLLGYTYYDYTDNFDEDYQEINLGADWKFLSAAAAIGEYDGDSDGDGEDDDYTYFELTAEHNGFFATVGSFGDDFDGEYVKAGYGTEIATVDVSASYIYSNGDLLGGDSDQWLIIQVSKGFTFDQVLNAWRGLQQ